MRILVTLHNFFPEPLYGAERICLLQMRRFLQAGHSVGLFYAGNAVPGPDILQREHLSGLELFPSPYLATKAQVLLSVWKPQVAARFRRALVSFKPDVVLFHHLVRLSLDLPSIARAHGARTVCYLHDYYLICPSYSLFDAEMEICHDDTPAHCIRCLYETRFGKKAAALLVPLIVPWMKMRERLVTRLVDDVDLFISPSTSLLFQMGKRGMHMHRSMVIPHGIDRIPGPPYRPRKPVRFGYIGNLNRKKGIDTLVRAFSGELSALLTIRGFADADAMEQFRRANPGFRAKLEPFSGSVTDFYADVDAIIIPSVWLENQPTVLLEAYAHGKPVICSRLGGIEELVRDGHGGLLFTPGDDAALRQIVERLAANPSELSALASRIPHLPTSDDYAQSVLKAIEGVRA